MKRFLPLFLNVLLFFFFFLAEEWTTLIREGKQAFWGPEPRPLVRLIAARRWIVAVEGHSQDFARSDDRRGNGAPDERDVKQRREQSEKNQPEGADQAGGGRLFAQFSSTSLSLAGMYRIHTSRVRQGHAGPAPAEAARVLPSRRTFDSRHVV